MIEVEVEVVPEPLQFQFQEGTPKTKRVIYSSTRKASTTKDKGTITIDLKVAEELPMADSVPKPQNFPVNTKGQESNLALAKFSPTMNKD